MRIIVTGARDWKDHDEGVCLILEAIDREAGRGPRHSIIHGGAQGIDQCAEGAAQSRDYYSVSMPADWKRHGRKAGPIRNQAMADAGADLCLAFPLPGSRGTWDMVRRAEAAGIRTVVIKL